MVIVVEWFWNDKDTTQNETQQKNFAPEVFIRSSGPEENKNFFIVVTGCATNADYILALF